jgi:hypothetical protein
LESINGLPLNSCCTPEYRYHFNEKYNGFLCWNFEVADLFIKYLKVHEMEGWMVDNLDIKEEQQGIRCFWWGNKDFTKATYLALANVMKLGIGIKANGYRTGEVMISYRSIKPSLTFPI